MFKKIISSSVILALVCALCVSAASCKSSSSAASSQNYTADMIPGGVADVSAEVIEALSQSGEVSVYIYGDKATEEQMALNDYFTNTYGGILDMQNVTWNGWQDVFFTAYAAGDAPDVIEVFYKNWPKAANRSMVYSISDLKKEGVIGLDHPVFDDDKEICARNFSYKGEVYALGVTFVSAVYCCVNLDLFEQYNVKSPVEYYQEGTWNYDTFVKCCKELTRDTDGDSVNDVFGFHGWDMNWFVVANDAQLIEMDENGNLEEKFDSAKVTTALNNIHQNFNVDRCMTRDNSFVSGDTGILGALKTNISKTIGPGEVTFDWDIVPFPYGPDNDGGVMPGDMNGHAICSATDNPQGALNYIIACKVFKQLNGNKYDTEYMSIYSDQHLQMFSDYDRFAENAFFMGVGSLWSEQWDFWTALESGRGTVPEVLAIYQPVFKAQCELEMDNATA